MLTTTSRLQENTVMITLPPKDGKKPEPNKEYIVEYSEDGTILLTPKMDDPFVTAVIGEFYEKDEWVGLQNVGREFLY